MQLTPINMAEAIIEPFWDGALTGLKHWHITDGAAHGLKVSQNWCWLTVEWARRPASGPALSMTREFAANCADYDDLLVSLMAPATAVLEVTVETNLGTITGRSEPFGAVKQEVAVDLRGAIRIGRVTLALHTDRDELATGWFNWIGLRHRQLLARYERQWKRFDEKWEDYLRPEDFVPAFKPAHGLFVTEAELEAVRTRLVDQNSPFDDAGRFAAERPPEKWIGDYVNFWDDTRYNRVRDHGKHLLGHGPNAAIAGLLRRDPKLLHLAARYALSIASCEHWDDGFICRLPGGLFEHRCFVQSLCAFEIALILDLAGEMFTWQGQEFLRRRLAEEALGTIDFNVWKHEYIHHCNQLAWFTPGRVLAMLVLEQGWPRVKPYTEQAIAELQASLEKVILSDGGYLEGPGYFVCVGWHGCLPLYLHARARGRTLADALPAAVRRCGDFGEVVASTDKDQDHVAVCDAGAKHDVLSLAMLAAALPGSAWARMFAKRNLAETLPPFQGQPRVPWMANLLLALVIERQSPPVAATIPVPLVALPDLGWAASTRTWNGQPVKLFLMGNKAGAGHTHEDKGSFVLEYAGETFALDPGTCDYSSPFARLATMCDRHNMLVPVVTGERAHPQCPLPHDVKPRCTGDATQFTATLEVTPGWEGFYKRWVRTWDSPTPDQLTITDEYELASGTAVDFFWMTEREVTVTGQTITLRGKRGTVSIEAEAGCAIRVEELPFPNKSHHRIAIRKSGSAGTMTTVVRLNA